MPELDVSHVLFRKHGIEGLDYLMTGFLARDLVSAKRESFPFVKNLMDVNFWHVANSRTRLNTTQHQPPVLPRCNFTKTFSASEERFFQHVNGSRRYWGEQMRPQKTFLAEIMAMIETSMLDQMAVFVVPANVLPAHIKIVILHELKLGLDLVWQKLIVIVQKSEILTCGTTACVIPRSPSPCSSRRMYDTQP